MQVAELFGQLLKPPVLWTHFPAGAGKLPPATAGRLRGYGLKAGMPDYLVIANGITTWIELKTVVGRLSKVQEQTIAALREAGCPVYVCRNIEEVVLALNEVRVTMYRPLANAILEGTRTWRAELPKPRKPQQGEIFARREAGAGGTSG